jgi:hypothetical protein
MNLGRALSFCMKKRITARKSQLAEAAMIVSMFHQ